MYLNKKKSTGIILLSMVALLLIVIGCENSELISSTANQGDDTDYPPSSLQKITYFPQDCSNTFRFRRGAYASGIVKAPNGSHLKLVQGALTPPSDTPYGQNVTLKMRVDKNNDTNEMIFSFGPSGCQFTPPAELCFSWADLGSQSAVLYYIDENGTYIEQTPDHIDTQNQRMTIYIDHFSRYAIGME